MYYDARGVPHTYGTINMNAVTASGDIASVTTTSGLSWKIPGRIGDSPIVGAGQYCDNEVGAAGSTGRGEANIKVCGAFLAVEFMRQGKTPEQALMMVMERVLAMTEKRLLNDKGRPYFDLNFYAVNKKGEYAGACAYEGGDFAVCDAKGARVEKEVYLFKKEERPTDRPVSGTLIKPSADSAPFAAPRASQIRLPRGASAAMGGTRRTHTGMQCGRDLVSRSEDARRHRQLERPAVRIGSALSVS